MHGAATWSLWKVNGSRETGKEDQNLKYYWSIPPYPHLWRELSPPEMDTRVRARELREVSSVLAPAARRGTLNVQRVWKLFFACSSFFFSSPLPSPPLPCPPPFLFHPFPPFFYAPAPRNLVGVVASHQPKLWDRGNSLCLQWCHSSQKLGPSPTAFFPSLCPLSAWRYLGEVIDVHGRVSFLSRDSKGVPGNQKVSGRSWSGRNWAKKPHKVFFKINFCTHPSNYTCMDLIISTSKLWGLCLGARLTIQWHAHGTEPSCTAKALKSEMTREPEPLENQLVAWNTQSEPNQVECILNQKY